MAEHKLVGLPDGYVDTEKNEIHFKLSMSDSAPISFVAKYGAATQVTGALGRMIIQLQEVLVRKNSMEPSPSEEIRSTLIHKERWSDVVVMQLTTTQGVPYTFSLPRQIAADIADQLKTESAKPTQTGQA